MILLVQAYILLLPLIFFLGTSQHFELPKFAFVLATSVLFAVVRAYEIMAHKNFSLGVFRSHRIFFLVSILLGVYLSLQTFFFSYSPLISFWGTYERHQGLLLLYCIWFLMFLLLTRTWKHKEILQILYAFLVGGVLVSLTALIQFFSVEPFGSTAVSLGRIFGSMGHPNFLGQYLLCPLFIHLYFFYSTERPTRPLGRVALSMSFVFQLFTLFATGNRASILGFFVVLILGALIFFRHEIALIHKKRIGRIMGFFMLALGFLFLFYVLYKAQDPVFFRSFMARAALIPSLLEVILLRPYTGYGLDMFTFAFSPYFPSGMGEFEAFHHLPDRAHILVLDIVLEQGLIGLILLTTGAWYLAKQVKDSCHDPDLVHDRKILILALLFVLIALFISYQGGFETIVTKVSTGIVIVLLLLLTARKLEEETHFSTWLRSGVVMLMLFLGGVGSVLGVKILYGDILYEKARQLESPSLLLQAIQITPYPYEYLLMGVDLLKESSDKRIVLDEAQKWTTRDYFLYLQLGRMYAQEKRGREAKEAFEEARKLCVHCPIVTIYGAEGLLRSDLPEEAQAYLRLYLEQMPSFAQKTFLSKEDQPLSSFEQERLRIFLKENMTYITFALSRIQPIDEREKELMVLRMKKLEELLKKYGLQ